MGLDVDFIAAKQSIDKLSDLVRQQEHGYREEIADDIIDFVDKMEGKYCKRLKRKKV